MSRDPGKFSGVLAFLDASAGGHRNDGVSGRKGLSVRGGEFRWELAAKKEERLLPIGSESAITSQTPFGKTKGAIGGGEMGRRSRRWRAQGGISWWRRYRGRRRG